MLQSEAVVITMRSCIKKEQLIAKWGRQIGARAITMWGRQFIVKWVNRYCEVGQVLLSGASILQGGVTITKKVRIPS